MHKCGITGHTGVIGSNFIKKKFGFKFIKFKGDISNKGNVHRWIKTNSFDLIIHFAAIVPIKIVENNYSYANKVNYIGTKNLVDAIINNKRNLKWFFFFLTSHVYNFNKKKKIKENFIKKPFSKYGKTKLKAEKYIKFKLSKYKIPYCIGRIFSFTHPSQHDFYLIPRIFKKIRNSKNREIIFHNMNHYRDFVSVNDICEAINFLWKKRARGVFNVAKGKIVYIKAIAKYLCDKFKKKSIFIDNKKVTYLIADINKINNFGWKAKKNIFQILNEF